MSPHGYSIGHTFIWALNIYQHAALPCFIRQVIESNWSISSPASAASAHYTSFLSACECVTLTLFISDTWAQVSFPVGFVKLSI